MGSLVFSFLLPTRMKVYILTMLIVAVCIDIGSSKPTHTRKKRQLTGTGVSFGSALNKFWRLWHKKLGQFWLHLQQLSLLLLQTAGVQLADQQAGLQDPAGLQWQLQMHLSWLKLFKSLKALIYIYTYIYIVTNPKAQINSALT